MPRPSPTGSVKNVPLTLLLPSLIPLFGAAICPLRVFTQARLPLRRWLYMVFVALAAVGVIIARLPGAQPLGELPQTSYFGAAPVLLWTPLGALAAGLLLGAVLAGQLVRRQRPLAPEHASLRLVLLAACMGVLAAGNLLTLCVAWSIQLLALLMLRALWRESEAEKPRPWEIWSSLLSSGLLMLGAVAMLVQQEGDLSLIGIQPGLALNALAVAIALRILNWPRAGGLRRHWETYLMSLVTGLYLWLRIGPALQADGTLLSRGVGIGIALILAGLGLTSALHRRAGRALPYVLTHWAILALLAPLVDPAIGFVASLLIALHLVVSLLALRIHQTSDVSLAPLGGLAYLVAWASLGGFPLTLGFIAHWLLVRSCWETGAGHLITWVLISFVANAIPAWSQVRSFAEGATAEELPQEPVAAAEDEDGAPDLEHLAPSPRANEEVDTNPMLARLKRLVTGEAAAKPDGVAIAASGLAALALLAVGIVPGLVGALWPQAPLDLSILGYSRLLGGSETAGSALALATACAPLLAGLTLHRRWMGAQVSSLRPFYRSRRVVNTDWLYTVAKEQADHILAILGQGLDVLEGSFSLAWVLIWGIALIYYMVGA